MTCEAKKAKTLELQQSAQSLQEEDLGCTKIGWEPSTKIYSSKPRMETETPPILLALALTGREIAVAEVPFSYVVPCPHVGALSFLLTTL